MKFIENLQINEASRFYISGIIFSIIALFVIIAVVFLWLFFDKIAIIMNQPSDLTYAYFLLITGRILAVAIVLMVIPLSIYQLFSKNKSKPDVIISIISLIILTVMITVFMGGQLYIYNKHTSGELSNSKLFEHQTIETNIYNNIMSRE